MGPDRSGRTLSRCERLLRQSLRAFAIPRGSTQARSLVSENPGGNLD